MSARKPYSGRRKLVVGIDIGTTFSGVSYSILDPGVVPIIQGVNRYPAQEKVGGDAKIPSIILYDSSGAIRAVGAEAALEANIEQARDEQWLKAEWFKLHLRPNHGRSPNDEVLPPLPLNKTVEQVFGDFLRYLYNNTRDYIQETHAGGVELWNSLKGHADFVLTHPNGWEGAQQAQMRKAAILAGLVPDTDHGRSRIHFVTEGEASVHFCIGSNYASEVVKSGEGVIIADAGGGTIDLSAFQLKKPSNVFEEIAPASCHFQGSIYVTRRARAFLESKLYDSRYGAPDDIDHITDCFDRTTKLAFRDTSQVSFIKFGTTRDTDPSVDVKFGQLKLQGLDVAKFFEPCLDALQEAIQQQKAAAHAPIKSVLLVGGFAASNWLFQQLQTRLTGKGLRLYRPDGHLGKAVADGAVSFLIDHFVSVRVARTTFGTDIHHVFDPFNRQHQLRSDSAFMNLAGEKLLPKGFDIILAKGTRVSETTKFRRAYHRNISKKTNLITVEDDILAYRGNQAQPEWLDVDPQMFSVVCTITADVQSAVNALSPLTGQNGETYFHFRYEIELLFGLTEHKAQICWKENGVEKRCPAKMVYDYGVGTTYN